MKKKRYGQEFKEQIIRECQEVGNAALVARRHGISKNTVHSWLQDQGEMVLLYLYQLNQKNSLSV